MHPFDIVLLVLAALALFIFLRWFIKRTVMIFRLLELKRLHGARIIFQRFPYLPTWAMSEKADIRIEILDTVYLIRLFSGGNKKKSIHFASPEYAVRYTPRMSGKMAFGGRWKFSLISVSEESFNTGVRVYRIPPLELPEEGVYGGRRVERVIIFNPAPKIVSYVTKERTTIRVAFTGDDVYGIKIFSASSFTAYADRMTREGDEPVYFN